jgi:hypothetical protein
MDNLRQFQCNFLKQISNDHITGHMAIYRKLIRTRFETVLQQIFPVCGKLVGLEIFLMMAHAYIDSHTSISYSLNHYGNAFAKFVASFKATQHLPYLSSLAQLEWAWHSLDTAPYPTPFNFQQLIECNPDQVYFALPKGSTLLASPYPLHLIWQVNQDRPSTTTIHLKDNEHYYFLVANTISHKCIHDLTHSQWQILSWVEQHLSLADICNRVSQDYSHIDITQLLPQLINQQKLTNLTIPNEVI